MRDERFIAEHRGGLLKLREHRLLAKWAADCAEHVLLAFWKNSRDHRPFKAVEKARAWSRGEIPTGDAMKAAVAAHAAARACNNAAAKAAARAAGHAVATAHMAEHCFGVGYALRAVEAAGLDVETERQWQNRKVPNTVRELVRQGQAYRLKQGRPF
jgi:hypothetical protein